MQRKCLMRAGAVALATLVLLVLSNSASLFAQRINTGKIEGIVQDKDTGAPLAGTQVVVEGTRLGNVTNADGYYFILNVPPGLRSVTFTYTGYQKTTVADVMILAGQTMTVDGALSSTVVQIDGITIEGESDVLLPRDETSTKRRLTTERLEELPATTLEDMLVLEAGVQIGGEDARSRGLKIRGGRLGEEAMIVDGVMVRNYTALPLAGSGGWRDSFEEGTFSEDATPLEFSFAAVEQVDIITGGFQAEYGNAQSGIINIVTKEGGPQLKVLLRYTSDGLSPRTSDWGYNQLTASIGGPVFGIPNLYFHASGEAQGQEDRTRTHADEGFRGIDQTFVDRLNDALRNDPYFFGRTPYSLEAMRIGREAFGEKTGKSKALFSPFNPVRLPGNWQDRTYLSGKITFSPISKLKIIVTDSWSRNQHSYPTGGTNDAAGNYFRTGRFGRYDPLYERLFELRDWKPGEEEVYIPQSKGRKTRANNALTGFDWDIFRSANNSGALQFRYTQVIAKEITASTLKTNWERTSWLGWNPHEMQFEGETWPPILYINSLGEEVWSKGRELWAITPNKELRRQYLPDGELTWKQEVPIEYPFDLRRESLYNLSYRYLRESQRNFKADLDFQLGRYNRAKAGLQYTVIRLDKFGAYGYSRDDPRSDFRFDPEIYSFYFQNRTDIGDFIIDYGVRYDAFSPNSNWGTNSLDVGGARVFPQVHSEWSPRFDVAFPVTDKAQLRFSYGVFTQMPSLDYIFGGTRGGGGGMRNRGGLEYSLTDAFEAGISYILTNDVLLDLTTYYRDVTGNVASKTYFVDYYNTLLKQRIREFPGPATGYSNRDNGNIKGVELNLRKRFSNNFGLDLTYTMQFSRTTGSSIYSGFYNMLDPATGESFTPPDELNPIDNDRTHQVSARLNYMFPEDFRTGTMAGTILKNFRIISIYRILSGTPYRGSSIGGIVYGTNYFRTRWFTDLNLRLTKSFRLGGAKRVDVFAEIFNALNRKNNVRYPSGYRYEIYDNVTGGVDLPWSEDLDIFQKAKFPADFDADGILTVEEAALGAIAHDFIQDTMDKKPWGTARQVRLGVQLNF